MSKEKRKNIELVNEKNYFPTLKIFSRNLTRFIKKEVENKPLVISLDAPWGYGKTTFLNMWSNELCGDKEIIVINFDAWKADYSENPLIVLIAELKQQLEKHGKINTQHLKDFTNKAKALAPIAVKFFLNSGLKCLKIDETFQKAIDEFSAELFTKQLEEHNNTQKLVQDFKESLKKLIDTDKRLFILIDELDRCKPLFAVELLEVVKHFFDISHCCFILAMNQKAISHTVNKIYGEKFDSIGYLERFFDRHIHLPEPEKHVFIENEIKNHPILIQEPRNDLFEIIIKQAVVVFSFNLREIQKYLYDLSDFLNTAEERIPASYFPAISFLIALRRKDNNEYNTFLTNDFHENQREVEALFLDKVDKHQLTRLKWQISFLTARNFSDVSGSWSKKIKSLDTLSPKNPEEQKHFGVLFSLREFVNSYRKPFIELMDFISSFSEN